MRKTGIRVSFVLLFCVMAVIFAYPASAADGKIVIKYGGTLPETHYSTKAMFYFKKIMEERSGGKVQVDVYTSNQIGGPRDLIEGLQFNTVQMCDNSIAAISGFTDKAMPLSLPFLFPSREVAFQFIDGEYGKALTEEIAKEMRVRIIGWHENGFRQLSNNKRTIKTPADLKGLKIRVMESPLYIRTFESLGTQPTPISFAELFTALQQGTIDGQDNPVAIFVANKYFEVQKYMSNLNHTFDFLIYQVSEDFYQGLPADIKKLYEECMTEATAYSRKLAAENEAADQKTAGEKIEYTFLTPEERAAFGALVTPVYDWFKKEYPHLAENVVKYQAEIARLNGK
ncbi:MAG: TRAP transporter substrate-binding protein [Synergistaceae bacterium]|nr:TRAP transporter substrate-binding protein [Synergistaceae bacterium]